MARPYEPTPITTGYGAEIAINDNLGSIADALEEVLNKNDTSDNAMNVDLDMNGNEIINCPSIETPPMLMNTYTASELGTTHLASANTNEIVRLTDGGTPGPVWSDGTNWRDFTDNAIVI